MCGRPISVGDAASRADEPGWIPVCDLSRLKAETIVRVRVAGIEMLVVWNDGEVAVCERACPHEQADLGLGHVAAGRLFCPRHAASFDLCDGAISSGWPSPPLRLYPVRVIGEQVAIAAGPGQSAR
jgi:3-phenylpropionate/trans-cinnamate dioxygenase ferredoxin component